jgi:hypothetical protein
MITFDLDVGFAVMLGPAAWAEGLGLLCIGPRPYLVQGKI